MARPKGRTVKREDVVSAAMALLDEGGPDAVTLSNVANRLGLRTPSLYNHVAGSSDLEQAVVLEVLERTGAEVLHSLEPDMPTRDPEGFLRAWAWRWRSYALRNPSHIKFLMAAPVDWSAMPYSPTWNTVMERLGQAMGAMGLAGVEALHGARYTISTVQGYVRFELRGARLPPGQDDQGFGWALDRVMEGIRLRVSPSSGLNAA